MDMGGLQVTMKTSSTPPIIDVIVPVYGAEMLTRECINSVLESRCSTPFELVVVDDDSPEPALSAWLEELAGQGRIRLLRNPENLGFVRSVNRGMALHPDRDVVLLNSDTRVGLGWLDRLRECACRQPDTGTVTPLSNRATLASYPRFPHDNPLPEGFDVPSLDRLCARLNAGLSVAVPTAVGFCMYIRRDCLDAVGFFDAERFGRGYGEENDFCRRAAARGFVHLLCGSVFVGHESGSSFGDTAAEWRERAGRMMWELHPDYDALVAAHLAADPQRVMRRRLDLARLMASPRPRILMVTGCLHDKARQHQKDIARVMDRDIELLSLSGDEPRGMRLSWLRPGEEDFALWYRMPAEKGRLLELLRLLQLAGIHVHHAPELREMMAQMAAELGVNHEMYELEGFSGFDAYPESDADGGVAVHEPGPCRLEELEGFLEHEDLSRCWPSQP